MSKKPYKEIDRCRLCGNKELAPVLSLGTQALTGVFPKTRDEKVAAGPLELVKCRQNDAASDCGLVQLKQSYDKNQMYGGNYGYRSGLNPSMARHLHDKVEEIMATVKVRSGDLVLDIGSNDGTLLKAYPRRGLDLVGIDPTAEKFRKYYPPNVRLICDFFSKERVKKSVGAKRAKVITSIAMLYDLDSPMDFVAQIRDLLADDGVWVAEQSYLPAMIEQNAYDTICHEHLEYYALRQIQWMTDRLGLKIIGLELNDINGGSFSFAAAKREAPYPECTALIRQVSRRERKYEALAPYRAFRRSVLKHRREMRRFLRRSRADGKLVLGYGASTKGNVILQFCGITRKDIPCIGEVNQDKFGSFTPGTLIPIVSEQEAKAMRPDCLVVLPWHFREFILKKEAAYLRSGGKMFFPLPRPRVY